MLRRCKAWFALRLLRRYILATGVRIFSNPTLIAPTYPPYSMLPAPFTVTRTGNDLASRAIAQTLWVACPAETASLLSLLIQRLQPAHQLEDGHASSMPVLPTPSAVIRAADRAAMAMPAQALGSSKAVAATLRGVGPAPSSPQQRSPAAVEPSGADPPDALSDAATDLSASFLSVSDSDARRWHLRSLLEVAGGVVVSGSDGSGEV